MKITIGKFIRIGLLSLIMAAAVIGCKTAPDRVALNAAGIQVITVDAGMKAFKDQTMAGKVTQSQLDAVNKYYPIYYEAALLEKRALETYATVQSTDNLNALQAAVDAAIASEADIIKLLNAALPKTVNVVAKAR